MCSLTSCLVTNYQSSVSGESSPRSGKLRQTNLTAWWWKFVGGEKVVQHFNDYMKGAGVFVSRETRTELHSFYSVLYTSNSRPVAL